MNTFRHIKLTATRLRLWAAGDPVAERLDTVRRHDGAMFRRHRAFLPWAP
jgi:hypothetical protein